MEYKLAIAGTETNCNIGNGSDTVYLNLTVPSIPPTDYLTSKVVHLNYSLRVIKTHYFASFRQLLVCDDVNFDLNR